MNPPATVVTTRGLGPAGDYMSQDEFIPLAIPREQSRRFDRNYIRIAVCEFRYPTLLDLEEKHPTKFQRTLRKDYPYYSKEQGVSLGDAGAAPLGPRYLFESKNRDWTINLGASTLHA